MTTSAVLDTGDIDITRGINDPPVVWQFLESIEPDVLSPVLQGRTVYLIIAYKGETLVEKDSASSPTDLVADIDDALVEWTPTLAETLAIPLGRLAQYRLEWRSNGTHGFLSSGFVNVKTDGPDIP